jgi:ceramide glucosyltransferase
MIPQIARAVGVVAGCGALAGVGYYVLCLWSAFQFLRERRTAGRTATRRAGLPAVSILKPLKGVDPEMYESFRSHCVQDYPEYEIIFGVSDAGDPAVTWVQKLKSEFPQTPISVVVCSERLGANRKVSNLEQMMPQARYDYIVVGDSDIRVAPDYLRQVIGPLEDASVGLVTCLYRGVAAPTLGSRLESLGISTDFAVGVLAARQIEGGIHFGLGSTLAFRRAELQAIGGFKAIADYLGDDYEMGRRISDLGLKVELAGIIVETLLPAYGLRDFLSHQLRWARTIRDSRPGGYLGLGLTFALPWALLALVFSAGTMWAWALLGLVAGMRVAVAVAARMVLQDRQIPRLLWLLPLRDITALFVWLVGFMGHGITWRGDSFELKEGKLL